MDKENAHGGNGGNFDDVEVENYYDVLEVSPTATVKEIKTAFKRAASVYHPDKNASDEAVDIFAKCSEAYEVLSNPIHRGFYDMLVGVRAQTDKEIARLNNMKKEQAQKELAAMRNTVRSIEKQEEECEGLVIADAQYGDLRSKGKAAKINVRVALQCMVDSSALIVKAGSSKKWLEGFWDPCPHKDKQLYIRYKFLNALHECMLDDEEELCIPVQEHLIEDESAMEAEHVVPVPQTDVPVAAVPTSPVAAAVQHAPAPAVHIEVKDEDPELVHPHRPKPAARRSTPRQNNKRRISVPLTPGQSKLQAQVTFRQKRQQAKEQQRAKKRRRIFMASALALVLGFFFAKRKGYLNKIYVPGFGHVTSPKLMMFAKQDNGAAE